MPPFLGHGKNTGPLLGQGLSMGKQRSALGPPAASFHAPIKGRVARVRRGTTRLPWWRAACTISSTLAVEANHTAGLTPGLSRGGEGGSSLCLFSESQPLGVSRSSTAKKRKSSCTPAFGKSRSNDICGTTELLLSEPAVGFSWRPTVGTPQMTSVCVGRAVCVLVKMWKFVLRPYLNTLWVWVEHIVHHFSISVTCIWCRSTCLLLFAPCGYGQARTRVYTRKVLR